MKLGQKIKKTLGILFLFIITVFLAIACSRSEPSLIVSTDSKNLGSKSSDCRLIADAMGETCLFLPINRAITLGNLDNLLALGVKPVGAALWAGYRGFPSYLKDKTQNIIFLGGESDPNLEKIAYLKPDLILGEKQTHEMIYSHLSKISATVLKPIIDSSDPFFWKKQLLFDAEVLGKTETAQKLLNDYEQRLKTFKQQIEKKSKPIQVSVLRFYPEGVRIYLKDSFIGGILQDAGLFRPSSQDRLGEFLDISPELISELDGDVIFVMEKDRVAAQAEKGKESMLTRLKRNALWSKLKAVQNNQVYEISETVWVAGSGIIGVNLILDDLFHYLIETQ